MRRYIVSDIRGKLDDIDAEVPGLKAEIKASKIVTKTGEEILSSNALSHRALVNIYIWKILVKNICNKYCYV